MLRLKMKDTKVKILKREFYDSKWNEKLFTFLQCRWKLNQLTQSFLT